MKTIFWLLVSALIVLVSVHFFNFDLHKEPLFCGVWGIMTGFMIMLDAGGYD